MLRGGILFLRDKETLKANYGQPQAISATIKGTAEIKSNNSHIFIKMNEPNRNL